MEQVIAFISDNYKEHILKQIPPHYDPEQTLISIEMKLDLTKIFRKNRTMGLYIISHFPAFEREANQAVIALLQREQFATASHGIHLIMNISNCPLPTQNIRSTDFQTAAM